MSPEKKLLPDLHRPNYATLKRFNMPKVYLAHSGRVLRHPEFKRATDALMYAQRVQARWRKLFEAQGGEA